MQTRPEADLGVKELAGCQRLVLLDKTDDVERHLVVAAPRHIAEAIVNDSRNDVDVFLEDRRRVDGERGAGFVARQRLNGIEIKKVHNFEIDVSKLWTLYRVLKDANLIRGKECII